MTSPDTLPTPSPSSIYEPPRRKFGSSASRPSPTLRPSSSSSTTTSNRSSTPTPTPSPALQPLHNTSTSHQIIPAAALFPSKPAEPTRTRSASSASSDAFQMAADRSLAWLHNWTPKGEGRSREFIANTLNGVVSVAGTVGNGIGGAVGEIGVKLGEGREARRLSSFSLGGGGLNQGGSGAIGVGLSPSDALGSGISMTRALSNGSTGGAGLSPPQPPAPLHTVSTSSLPTGRRIPQPANLSRLGGLNTASTPLLSPPSTVSSPTAAAPSSAAPLPRSPSSSLSITHSPSKPHGSSHLNPNHVRSNSSSTSHRTSSFGGAKSPDLSRSSSTANGGVAPSTNSRLHGMPYKLGFQPAGVRNDRTGEYAEKRRAGGVEREKEEGRLGRRWAKLVDLHFNPTMQLTNPQLPTLPRSSSSSVSLSSVASSGDRRRSILSIDGALDAFRPKERWKGLKGAMAPVVNPNAEEQRRRAAEQAIVKWEDDGDVRKCRLCQSVFSISNRKHHCRLCGRIVCSLPPTPPALLAVEIQLFSPTNNDGPSAGPKPLPAGTRREKCSLLLVADWKTGRGEEVEEGFVGWMKTDLDLTPVSHEDNDEIQRMMDHEKRNSRGSISTLADVGGGEDGRTLPLPQQPKEVQVKGMRACRECWAVVSRKQKKADRARVTGFARLYSALKTLQAEIEGIMPDFEDAMDELTSSAEPRDPPRSTLGLHKQLLTLLAQYEHLSKRISSLPAVDGSGQATVQSAVARSAASFLAVEMIKVQALPKLQKRAADVKRKSMAVLETTLAEQLKLEGVNSTKHDDIANALQPLLEQEAQLEVMIADANGQRKYEDARALGEALEDIREEIGKMTRSAAAS